MSDVSTRRMMADKVKVNKAEDVQVLNGGIVTRATLHLTPHHLVLVLNQDVGPSSPRQTPPSDKTLDVRKPQEAYFPLPSIAFCTFRPTPPSSGISSSIRLRFRDFRFITINFADDKEARDVFESIKASTCHLGSIEKLHAFSYKNPKEKDTIGWGFYDPRAEWKRQGISEKGVDKGWRISTINEEYTFSPTYPALLVVPTTISDSTLRYAGPYRSRVRIPVLTYLHPINNCSITRSSQCRAGIRGNRSVQDEKLVAACFSVSTKLDDGEANSSTTSRNSPESSQGDLRSSGWEGQISGTEQIEDEIIAETAQPTIYGAQQKNIIVDARPLVNAYAMQAVGLGSENMDYYKSATKLFLGIDNIHVMRDSLAKVVDCIKDADVSSLPPNREQLAKTGWLKHIGGIIEGAALIARQVGIQHSHVLIHCSDGWDRTSQLSALAQILLDPYYRTIDGFIVLVEKDWLAFGHMFQHRSGHLNSEKWFVTQNDALAGTAIQPGGNGEGRGDALENALLSAKRFFKKDKEVPDLGTDLEREVSSFDDLPKQKKIPLDKESKAAKEATKPKETSPVFHQFLDATFQLLRQFPTRFEFNEFFLKRLLYHLYSCQYGTFLYNNEKDRLDERVQERTLSVWSYFLSQKGKFVNPEWDGGSIDDHSIGHERLILPNSTSIKWWASVFNRKDEEMNGPINTVTERYLGKYDDTSSLPGGRSVLTGVETSETSVHVSNQNNTPGKMASLREGIANLGIGMGRGAGEPRSSANIKHPLEVEMQ